MKHLILLLLFASAIAHEDKTLGMSEAIGQYWIVTDKGLVKVTCNMKLKCGGVEGGWMQIVDVDMNRDENCPEP